MPLIISDEIVPHEDPERPSLEDHSTGRVQSLLRWFRNLPRRKKVAVSASGTGGLIVLCLFIKYLPLVLQFVAYIIAIVAVWLTPIREIEWSDTGFSVAATVVIGVIVINFLLLVTRKKSDPSEKRRFEYNRRSEPPNFR